MKALFALAILLATATPIDPHFRQSPTGWLPSCPAGTTLVRHDPPPDCIWGTRSLKQKPTMGDMECIDTAEVKKLPACPVQ